MLLIKLLVVAGTRIGQASECFVYWKDPITNDTWGLNLTSPADARSFRECCVIISLLIFNSIRFHTGIGLRNLKLDYLKNGLAYCIN